MRERPQSGGRRWGWRGSLEALVFTEFPQERKGSPGGSDGKESACNAGDWVRSLGQEYPVGQRMAIHSIILAWKILGTEGPDGLQSRGLQSQA